MTRMFHRRVIGILILAFATTAFGDDANSLQTRMETPFEQGDGSVSANYEQGIRFYQSLDSSSPKVQLEAAGPTDSGPPLHLVLVSGDHDFDIQSVRQKGRVIILVNNAIHPGEPDGVDASMAFVRDLVMDFPTHQELLANVVVAVIPYYNIGGALNRNGVTRVNQNGPREYGFRGNARNYDLNRDFIKCDTLNARSFADIFRRLDPDVFIDTHVSNGADYQYVMTTAHSQKDKLGSGLGTYLDDRFEPLLFERMERSGFPTTPYVNSGGQPPDAGFSQFLDTPRYSTGYAGLFQTIGFMTETHMLKPYPQRVAATRAFLQQAVELLSEEKETIRRIRVEARKNYPRQERVAIAWEVDRRTPSKLSFRGYEASYLESNVTSGKRLFYDRNKPYRKSIDYFNHYTPSCTVALPAAYLIPRGWHQVIDLMRLHGVEMATVSKPLKLKAEIYHLGKVVTRKEPYEGHYVHDVVDVTTTTENIVAQPGDMLVPVDQDRARYVVETLEPEATDSLFRWNYFDSVLQQKESFSPYVFEETAENLLKSDKHLKARLAQKQKEDPEFAADPQAQLRFLYLQSQHYEPAHRRYPIARLQAVPEHLKFTSN